MYTEDLCFGVLWVHWHNMLSPCVELPILTVEIEPVRAYVAGLSVSVRYTAGSISVFARDKFV